MWYVESEKVTPAGILDIVVRSPQLGVLIVIENKIGAGEQHRQLKRYWDWMQKNTTSYETQALIYLTPRGDPSYSAEIADYYRMSYRIDVTAWLSSCKGNVLAPAICEILDQYIDMVKSL